MILKCHSEPQAKKPSLGFTLIELLLTIVVISVGLLGIMALFENASRGAMLADLNVVGASLAHEKLELIVIDKVRNGYALLGDPAYSDETFSGDLSVYTRRTVITEVSGSDFQTPAAGSGYKKVNVTVSWGAEASQRISVSTVLSNY